MAASAELTARLRDVARTEMENDPGHDLAHLDRVWANVVRIQQAEQRGADRVLVAGAYLHDLVNLPKDDPERHLAAARSAECADLHLVRLGYSSRERADVRHVIEAHSHSGGVVPQTIEARIVRDADRLDALGAIGLARVFLVSGGLGRPLYDPADPFARQREVDDTRWTLDHFKAKLLTLGDGMATNAGREMARERTDFLHAYLQQLENEL